MEKHFFQAFPLFHSKLKTIIFFNHWLSNKNVSIQIHNVIINNDKINSKKKNNILFTKM